MMSYEKLENKKIPPSPLFLCGCFLDLFFLDLHTPKAQPIDEAVYRFLEVL